MAEELKKKPAPKSAPKPEGAAAPEPKAPKGAKPAEGAEAPKSDIPVAAVSAPTAAELLGDDPNAKKIIKAKINNEKLEELKDKLKQHVESV